MINTKKSYTKDSVFDQINLKTYLSHSITIPKTEEEKFIYYNEIKNNEKEKTLATTKDKESEEELYNQLNKNHFNIKIEQLKISHKLNFIDLYQPLNFIGQGSFGLVISVKKKSTGEIFAAKIIKKLSFNSKIKQEEKIIKYLNHPRIIKLQEVINLENYLILIMDLMEGGSLKDFIINRYQLKNKNNYFIKDEESSIIIKNILEGLNYMHKMGIVHRDLKPENIMFKKPNDLNSLIICDFGISDKINYYSEKCGTLIYMSPEMIKEKYYDNLTDIFSCGIILYILESGGQHPFYYYNINKKQYIDKILNFQNWNFPFFFPNLARNLFMKLCKFQQSFRYNANKGLKHPWIHRNINNEKIPLSLFENLEKIDKLKNFKSMISVTMFFNLFINSNKNMINKNNDNYLRNNLKSPFDKSTGRKVRIHLFSYKKKKSFSQETFPEIINLNKSNSIKKINLCPIKKSEVPFIKYKIFNNNEKKIQIKKNKSKLFFTNGRNSSLINHFNKNSYFKTNNNEELLMDNNSIRTVKNKSFKLNNFLHLSKKSFSPSLMKYGSKIKKNF